MWSVLSTKNRIVAFIGSLYSGHGPKRKKRNYSCPNRLRASEIGDHQGVSIDSAVQRKPPGGAFFEGHERIAIRLEEQIDEAVFGRKREPVVSLLQHRRAEMACDICCHEQPRRMA